jgi:hypothetical protein
MGRSRCKMGSSPTSISRSFMSTFPRKAADAIESAACAVSKWIGLRKGQATAEISSNQEVLCPCLP